MQLLGTLRMWRGSSEIDLGPPQRRAVIALLGLASRPLSRNELIDALWPEGPPATAENAIQTHVKQLRQALEPHRPRRAPSAILPAVGSGYALCFDAVTVDTVLFGELVGKAREAHHRGDIGELSCLTAQALAMWHQPLADLPSLAGYPRVAALVAEWRLVVSWAAEAAVAQGRAEEVIAVLEEQARAYSLDENVQFWLLHAYRSLGRHVEALACYERFRETLAEELGASPGAELVGLFHQLLQDTSAPEAPRREVVPRLLPRDITGFCGRTADLHWLDLLAEKPGATAVISAIAGTAGVGKTALAVHWAHRVVARFPDGQLYVNLRGFDPVRAPMSSAEAIRGFLDALGVAPHAVPVDPERRVDLYRSLLAGKQMLVLLDNVRDAEQARPLLPGSSTCVVVITSRNHLASLIATSGAQTRMLDVLTAEEAQEFLAVRLGADRIAAEPTAVDDIIAGCARLPLALAIGAAEAATQPELALATLAAGFRRAPGDLDLFDSDDPPTDLRAVFSSSYRGLSPTAARLFRLFGVHPGPDTGAAAVASLAGLPLDQVHPLLTELTQAHLLSEPTPGRYAFHDLLRAYAQHLSSRNIAESEECLSRLLDHYLHSAFACALVLQPHRTPIALAPQAPGVIPEGPADFAQAMAWFGSEHQVLLGVIAAAAEHGNDVRIGQLAWTVTTYFLRSGHWEDQVKVQCAALEAAQRRGDLPSQGYTHRALSRTYRRLGALEEAEHHGDQAVKMYEENSHPIEKAHALVDHCEILEALGRAEHALTSAQSALRLYRAAEFRAGEANALNAVGWHKGKLGRFAEALGDTMQALDLLRSIEDVPGQAAALDSLGYIYSSLNRYDEAIAAHEAGLALSQSIHDRYNEAETWEHLGDILDISNEPGRARHAWMEALAAFRELGHPRADVVTTKLSNLT